MILNALVLNSSRVWLVDVCFGIEHENLDAQKDRW